MSDRSEAIDRLTELSLLTDNWDSYGAPPISYKALHSALMILVRTPSVVPTSVGGVQLEWRGDVVDLEIEIMPDGTIREE